MHPVILQQLAAERVSYMITKAEDWHLAHQARLARRSRASRQKPRPGLPRTQAEIEQSSANSAVPAVGMPGPSADSGQGCELALAERGNTPVR
jgi:hypothetical protein